MKRLYLGLSVVLLITSCRSTSVKEDVPRQSATTASVQKDSPMAIIETANKDTYMDIPVEIIGMPYTFGDVRGNHTLDYPIDYMHEKISRNAYFGNFSPLNFRVNRFVYEFKNDGSLIFHTYYSYDKTPADNGAFYPAKDNEDGTWELQAKYHNHSGGNCSLDFYNDIAISQAKLNEMRRDPSLGKVYDILLSVAEDMDYNYPAIGRKATFVTLPNGKEPLKGVCDDYSKLLIDRLTAANINGVSNIQKITGQNHAWVTLVYKGKTLYLDATWFDKNIIDENGVVNHTPYKDPRNMTFDNEIFTNHDQHHIPGGTRNIGS